jgi:hypothetical protein
MFGGGGGKGSCPIARRGKRSLEVILVFYYLCLYMNVFVHVGIGGFKDAYNFSLLFVPAAYAELVCCSSCLFLTFSYHL